MADCDKVNKRRLTNRSGVGPQSDGNLCIMGRPCWISWPAGISFLPSF